MARLGKYQHGNLIVGRVSARTWSYDSGDSYTSTNFSFSGNPPDVENAIGNPVYPGTTSTDGPNYIDFLISTQNQSLVRLFNLADGGSTINASLVPSAFGPNVKSFEDQVRLVPPRSSPSLPWTSLATLFVAFVGINDVFSIRTPANPQSQLASYESLIFQVS